MDHDEIIDFHNIHDSEEFSNYAKLLRLVLEEGTKRLKEYVLGHLPGRLPLDDVLLQKKPWIEKLKKRHVVNSKQFNQLYPKAQRVNVESFDLSLLYVLVRNVTEDTPKVNFNHFENKGPHEHDTLPQHDVIRIRNFRNELAHNASLKIGRNTFQRQWSEVEDALVRLGSEKDVIKNYETRNLDPMKTVNHYLTFRKQVYEELKSKYNAEKKMRKLLFGVAVSMSIIAIIILGIAVTASTVILNKRGKTWSSCLHNMESLYSKNVSGAISYIPRDGWHAQKPRGPTTPITNYPLHYVIITHTAVSSRCITTDDCCNHALVVQNVGFYWNFSDVSFNYMVGSDGVIYEGRGSGVQPAILKFYNTDTLGIAFMGTYIYTAPSDESVSALDQYLQYLVDQNILHSNFTIYGLCQMSSKYSDAPGAALYTRIKTLHGRGKNTWSWRERVDGYECQSYTE